MFFTGYTYIYYSKIPFKVEILPQGQSILKQTFQKNALNVSYT